MVTNIVLYCPILLHSEVGMAATDMLYAVLYCYCTVQYGCCALYCTVTVLISTGAVHCTVFCCAVLHCTGTVLLL